MNVETPVEIDFQGMEGNAKVKDDISYHLAELEDRYGRVTACRVVLKGPGGHHQTGGLYEVNIRLALPGGKEVNVERTRRRMNDTPISLSPSTMPSNGLAGVCRITLAVCGER